MPGGKRRQGPGDVAWEEFAGRHRGSRHLAHDPLYSLPERLIDHLVDQVPEIFDEHEEAFERDLAKTSRAGLFSRHRVVPCLLLAGPVEEDQGERDRWIRDAQAEHLEAYGIGPQRLDRFDEKQAEHDRRADLRAAAYAGWLVSGPQYLAERDDLRQREGAYVEEQGGFPSLPRSYLGEPAGAADPREARYHPFYRRWNLSSFLTWDLPLPLLPEVGVTTLDTFTLSGAGVTVFLPWYVAQDGRFSPDQLVAHLKSLLRPAHLEGWLAAPAGGGKALGDVRYRHYLALYRYRGLVLGRRYADRLGRRTMQLDRAFARYLGCGEDTVKKVRTSVGRAAGAAPA